MSAKKEGAYSSESPFRCYTLRIALPSYTTSEFDTIKNKSNKIKLNNFWHCLHNSAKQIYYSRCKVKYTKAFLCV